MNLNIAKKILELPDNFTPEIVKQNYHKLSLKYHPDKGGDTLDFIKLNQAHEFININFNKKIPVLNLNDIFKTTFNKLFKVDIIKFKKEIEINLTPQEFLEGCVKEIETTIKSHCSCEQQFCYTCKGFSFNTCNECMGSGIIQQCNNCINGFKTITKKIQINIPKNNLKSIILENVIIHLKLNDLKYIPKDNKLYYKYNISLKESLIGFIKTYKDPFGYSHIITSNDIVKQNDGYFISENLFLLFNIIYPKHLLKQLKNIDF